MNPVLKLALFAVVLAAMFAGGALLGSLTNPEPAPPEHEVHEPR